MRATLFTNVLADSSQDRLRLEGASLDQINQTTRTISRYDLICTILENSDPPLKAETEFANSRPKLEQLAA